MVKATAVAPRFISGMLIVAALALVIPQASAQLPEGEPTDLPFLSRQTSRGAGTTEAVEGSAPVLKTIDGDISDWVGTPSRYGGTSVYSAGEYIYQDHIFDAYGADDGRDADRFETTDPLEEEFPEAYRLDALAQADLKGELGAPIPDDFAYDDSYGDAKNSAADDEDDLQDVADLEELRLRVQDDHLVLLARTTTMHSAGDTALLLLADTVPDSAPTSIPFDSGITTASGDVALFIADGTVLAADLASGIITSLEGASAVAQPAGWANAIEASIPLSSIAEDEELSLALASGKPNAARTGFADVALETGDGTNPNLLNIAFRFDEPVRMWFERQQALALHAGSIDAYFTAFDADRLSDDTSERFVPGPGYHDRIFLSESHPDVPQESGENGLFQHYGVFLPSAYTGEAEAPLQWWLHWRGGHAHSGAAIVPKVMKQFGEDRDTVVVAPSGRGTSTWYVGKGHVDVLEVWADVFDTFVIDRSRVYVTGHSMGGWGSYLLPLVYPDRFAGAAPVAGPVTQGGWSGLDFPGCDEIKESEEADETPCYIAANGSRPRDQHNRKLLDNALHVPYAILQGTNDELVWWWAVSTNAARLTELGYRHRFYTYPGYEHYSHPIADQWAEAAAYLHEFQAPENPAQVVYKRDMPFERATEEVQSGGATLNFDFDSAYWMSGLTPTNMQTGVATFDGTSLAIPDQPHLVAPDTGPPTAPGQTGPYAITGLQWIAIGNPPEPANGFEATLTGASGVGLDAARMGLDTAFDITGTIDTEAPLALRLSGGWASSPAVLVDGRSATATLVDGVLEVAVPAGTHTVVILGVGAPVGAV